MTACTTNRCNQGRRQCPTPLQCGRVCGEMGAESDVGHKVAHGRRTDYFGRAAEGNPGYPFELLDGKPATEPSVWQWLEDLFYTAVYIVGSVAIGVILLVVVMLTTGLHRAIF